MTSKPTAKNKPDMSKLRAGNRVRFRNGGVSKVREVTTGASQFYPIAIKIQNFHAGPEYWNYDERGMIGERTGRGNICSFDIMEILK